MTIQAFHDVLYKSFVKSSLFVLPFKHKKYGENWILLEVKPSIVNLIVKIFQGTV